MGHHDGAGQEEDENGFERGSTRSFTFQVGRDLGELRRLHVQQVSPESMPNCSVIFLLDHERVFA